MKGVSLLIVAATLGALAPAQNHVVSPGRLANATGNQNGFALLPAMRHQQIHGDLRGRVFLMNGMALRRDAYNGGTARTIDAEVVMANADLATATAMFAANHGALFTTVIPRMQIQLPATTTSLGRPEPWLVLLPFTNIYPYVGISDFLWEIRIHASSTASYYYVDGWQGETSSVGTERVVGPGCLVTGAFTPMNLSTSSIALRPNPTLRLHAQGWSTARSAPVALWFGLQNPNLTVPGLCTNLFATPQVVLSTTSTSFGEFVVGPLSFPWLPAFAGLKLYSQAACPDAGQAGIPLALSRGFESILPQLPADPEPIVRWSSIDPNATTATSSSTGGMVVRFAY